jgi:hypothetical protein
MIWSYLISTDFHVRNAAGSRWGFGFGAGVRRRVGVGVKNVLNEWAAGLQFWCWRAWRRAGWIVEGLHVTVRREKQDLQYVMWKVGVNQEQNTPGFYT